MSVSLSKVQKQQLGDILQENGYEPKHDFIYEDRADDGDEPDTVCIVCRESSDHFRITRGDTAGNYLVRYTIPGTRREKNTTTSVGWGSVISRFAQWASDVKEENQAVDPWQQDAENMANDDSYFTVDEWPKVDNAIEESIADLKQKAIEHGKTEKQIQGQLDEIKLLLQKSARTSTKREWMSIFKAVIVEKLVDWGMKTVLFQSVLHTLVASAQDIAQLAEHASRHMP